MEEGLHFVYTGNVHDREGGTTFCPSCRTPLIVRDWHRILDYRLTETGACPQCATAIAGRFGRFELQGQFGRRRVPIAIARRPQLASPANSAVLTSGECATENATARASATLRAPPTATVTNRVAPSPSRTVACASSTQTSVMAAATAL